MDHELWYWFLLNNAKSVKLNKVVAAFRIHPESKTSLIMPRFDSERQLLLNRYTDKNNVSLLVITLYRIWKVLRFSYVQSFLLSICLPKRGENFSRQELTGVKLFKVVILLPLVVVIGPYIYLAYLAKY